MLNRIIRYLQGYLQIRITGTSPERFLNLCSYRHIYLWGLQPQKESYEMFVSIRDFRKLKPVMKKTRTKVTIVRRLGMPFFFHRYRKRKVFFAGAFLSVIAIYFMSLFIWNIHIEGNFTRTDEVLLEFLESQQIRHGMFKKKVNCERIVKDIRKEFDDIVWVSAYVKGTRLMIKVKENTDTFLVETATEKSPNDIIAKKDGMITKMVTRSGIPLVKPGDNVKKGDTLVSGIVEVKNDAGEIVNSQYLNADADIEAETLLPYEYQRSFSYLKKRYTGSGRTACRIRLGNTVFQFGILKNQYSESEQFTNEKQIKLGEHFWLPVTYGMVRINEYKSSQKVYDKEKMRILLSAEFANFCETLEEDGTVILEKDVKIYLQKDVGKAKGTLRILESIGEDAETKKIDFQ